MNNIPVGGMTIERLKDELTSIWPGLFDSPSELTVKQIELLVNTSFAAGKLAGFDEVVASVKKTLTRRT